MIVQEVQQGVQKKDRGKQVRNILHCDSCGVGKLWLVTPRRGGHGALCQWDQQDPGLAQSVGHTSGKIGA